MKLPPIERDEMRLGSRELALLARDDFDPLRRQVRVFKAAEVAGA